MAGPRAGGGARYGIEAAADSMARYAEAARQRFNLAGGSMGRLEGWTPQRHDAEKLLRAGPVAGMVESAAKVPALLFHGEPRQARDQFITTALDNAPFVNMWHTRTALNYALLYHVKEWMSPGSLRRMERRMRKQQRREFFLPPSSVIARGGGFR